MTDYRRLIGRAAAVLLTLAAVAGPAVARDVTAEEREALATTVARFDEATKAMDMTTIIGLLPPTMLNTMATEFGLEVDALSAAMVEQSAAAMEAVTLVSFGMDVAGASFEEAPDGMPYVLIPTETVMELGETRIRATSDTLALLEDGAWYLLRVDPAQLELLKKAYPNLADVTLDPGGMEAVEA